MLAYLAAGLVGTLLASLALAELHREIFGRFVTHWDMAIQAWVHARASSRMNPWMELLSWVGGPLCAPPICLGCALGFWRKHQRRAALLLVNSMLGSAILDTVLKLHFHRLRPEVPWSLVTEHSYSFPSGHSVAAAALYGTLLYLLLRLLHAWWVRGLACGIALAMALGIGYSRVYLGAHWPSDVLAGYCCGLIWVGSLMGADLIVRRELPRALLAAAGR